MPIDKQNQDDLFKADRRVIPRIEKDDRRVFLRPTNRLKGRGFLWAAGVAAVLSAVIYFSWN